MRETKFKKTDIGYMPEDWECVPLRNLIKIGNGRDYKHLPTGKIPVYGTGGLMTYVNDYLYDGETVCIGRKGTIDAPQYHKGKIWTVDTLFYTHSFNGVEPLFLYYFFCTVDWYKYNAATGVPSLTSNAILDINMPLPSSIEQDRVAKALSDVDSLITSLTKLIEKKKNVKTATMQQLLTGKTRLEGFNEPWVERKLGDILSYEQPSNYLVQSSKYVDGGIPVLTAGKTFILGYTNEAFGIYNKLPVIIFDDFTTDSRFVTFPFKAKSSAMKMLKANSGYDIRLVYELLQMIDYIPGDHQRHWISMFADFSIMVPSTLEEQTAIASIFSDMDNEISFLEQKRAKYEAIKKGMMQELLTGRIRLV